MANEEKTELGDGMKKYFGLLIILSSFAIVSILVLFSDAFAQPTCPPTTPSMSSSGQSWILTLFDNPTGDKISNGWYWGITYSINDAAVLIDQNGNVIPSAQSMQISPGTYKLEVISSGEYYDCGGTYDSPPVTFGNQPVYYSNTPPDIRSWGGYLAQSPPAVHDSVYCNPSQVVISDNGVPLQTTPSPDNTEFSFTIGQGTHNLQISRDMDCKYSFYSENNYPQHGYVYFTSVSGKSLGLFLQSNGYGTPLKQNDSVDIPNSTVTPPTLNYFLNAGPPAPTTTTSAGTCENGCSSGFVCCENVCRDTTKGVCRDIYGNGVPVWVPY